MFRLGLINEDDSEMSYLTLREGELERITKQFPDRVPVFITRSNQTKDDIPDIPKKKFLVPSHFIMAEFILVIRKMILLKPNMAIFIFINDSLPVPSMTIGELYSKHKDKDGVLRMTYASENTFG